MDILLSRQGDWRQVNASVHFVEQKMLVADKKAVPPTVQSVSRCVKLSLAFR